MSFRSVFIALVVGFGLVLGGFLVNRQRPRSETEQPTAALVRASGKCAECHSQQQFSVVHEYEMSAHARKGVTCLDCHQPAERQEKVDHHGFVIGKALTAANCRSCHPAVYEQFARSRHGTASWAAVYGEKGSPKYPLTAEQVNLSEQFHPGSARRPANPLVSLEGSPAVGSGCVSCHSVGRPNADGSIGTCTACHARHSSSVALARLPSTCGQCHLGPDHSQMEIYTESKHGVLFAAQRNLLNLAAEPNQLTTRDMFVPTCATCHMSGLNGSAVTHDPSDRLSYNLFAEITEKRVQYARAQAAMKDLCANCHTRPQIDRVYTEAEEVIAATNEKVKEAKAIIAGLRKDGILTDRPFQTPIDFTYFDLWHYYGRTSKHGAFMGGADFVQWHGNYPILKHTVEMQATAAELRREHAKK
jgi:nitrate/TMAO reductase-like tetraheme cytochrome c subunit